MKRAGEKHVDDLYLGMKKKRTRRYMESKAAARTLEKYRGEVVGLNRSRACMHQKEQDITCDNEEVESVSWETKMRVYYRGRARIAMATRKRMICAFCDVGISRNEGKKVGLQSKTATMWRSRVAGNSNASLSLRSHYSVKEWIPELKGALISKKEVEINEDGRGTRAIFTCYKCLNAMRNGKKVPKCTIANGFDIGELPSSLPSARDIEKRLSSLKSIVHNLKVLSGGRRKSLTEHVSLVRKNPTLIVGKLPNFLREREETFLVNMTLRLMPKQELLAMKKHEVRVELVRRLSNFYVSKNEIHREKGVKTEEDAMISSKRETEMLELYLREISFKISSETIPGEYQ